jgi:2',3'-cyclic-nucleotide 2'-phosphodiesterase (5'-nucleotidase family)
MVESIRSTIDHLLLVDCGGFFADRGRDLKLKNDVSLKAMNLMGYDALNLGSREFSLGVDFLKSASSDMVFPLVTSNLVYKDSRLPFGKKYIIKNAGGLKVAILGVMPVEAFEKVSNPQYADGLKIIPPETALKNLLPTVRKKADFIILLSQCGFETTTSLVNNLNGIDLAISCGKAKPCCEGNDDATRVVQTGSRGKQLGFLQVTMSNTAEILLGQGQLIELDKSVHADKAISKIIRDAFAGKAREKKRLATEKKRENLHKNLMDGLQSTPMKYFELQQKRETENKGQKNE